MIRARMAVTVDGFVATTAGRPAWLLMPDFAPGASYAYAEFNDGCDAVVMGRTTFDPALGAPQWPWPGKRVLVLTSGPLPDGLDDLVVAARSTPEAVLDELRAARFSGDVMLLGGPQTVQSFCRLGAVDRFHLVVLPILLGAGVPLSPPGTPELPLRLVSQRAFPDGAVELVYAPR